MRILSGVAVLLLVGVFFALPLYAAMTACTMPCCQHLGSAHPAITTESLPCGGSVCVIRADETTAAATRSIDPPAVPMLAAPTVTTAIAVLQPPTTFHVALDSGPPPSDAPLHLLNSTFRI